MSAALYEINERLKAKWSEFNAIYEPKKVARDWTDDEKSELKRLTLEMDDIGAQRDNLMIDDAATRNTQRMIEDAKAVNALPTPQTRTSASGETYTSTHEVKSLAQVFKESQQYQALRVGAIKTAVIEVPYETFVKEMGQKTLLSSPAWTFQADRRPGILESVQTDITVSDLMLQGTVDQPSFAYMEETTFTNAAAEVAEGVAKPEAALGFTETTEQVRKIAVNIPVTDEMLSDVAGMEQFIRGRLGFMVERRREAQLLSGNGTSPNLRGILNRTGIQTTAKASGEPVFDAIYRAITNINVNADADATAIVMHPTNWATVRTVRTGDGAYMWGHPSEEGVDRIFGLPVRKTTGIPLNTALVGAFRPYAEIRRRAGLTITASTEHSTFFIENKVMIQAEERLGLAVYRPAAFHTVTALNVV